MSLNELVKELKKQKKVLIFSHIRPDGDTIGSAAGLKHILNAIDIEADLICEDKISNKFDFVVDSGSYYNAVLESKNYDAYIAVDSSDEYRLGQLRQDFMKGKKTFNIDHHISNTRFADYNYVTDVAATAQIILDIALILNAEITEKAANCLLLGICTDTGNFAHKNVTESTLLTASKLVGKGADLHKISYEMFKSQSKERADLFASTMSKIRYFASGKIAIIAVTENALVENNAKAEMTEGFIDFPLSVRGVEVAVCMLQYTSTQFKISFRSKGLVNVNEVASIFGGGGHILASGCMIGGDYEEIVDKIVFAISQRL